MRVSFEDQDLDAVLANPDFAEFMLRLDALGIFADRGWDGDSGT